MPQKPLNIVTEPYAEDENARVGLTDLKEVEFADDHVFVRRGRIFRIASFCFLVLLIFALRLFVYKLYYGIRIKDKKNLKAIKKSGAVICINHVFPLDVPMLVAALGIFRMSYILVAAQSFGIPVVRTIIKLGRCVPVSSKYKSLSKMQNEIIDMLKAGGRVIIPPEANEWAYYHKVRKFRRGAFFFANKASVPVLPAVFGYRRQRGIWFWKKRPCFDLQFLPVISCYDDGGNLKSSHDLMEETHKAMSEAFDKMLMKQGYVRAVQDQS